METMLLKRRNKGGPSPVVMPADENTLFRMTGFATAADIKDKGPNAVPVTQNGLVTVGSDARGSYMYFNGNAYFSFSSPLLNRTNIDVTFIVGEIAQINSTYCGPLLDTRAYQTNGDLHILTILNNAAPPYKLGINHPTTAEAYSQGTINAWPARITMRIQPSGLKVFINGVLAYSQTHSSPLNTANLRVGNSAWQSAGVPNIIGKIYYIDVKNIPT